MAIPTGLSGVDLVAFLQDLDERVAQLETPAGFTPVFLTTSAKLTTASAAQAGGRVAIATDLKTLVWSDGVHWRRADTGAQIV